jgi:prevent-host-death family protein
LYYAARVRRIPIRELNQQTATVLAHVERGETIEITKQGRVIGRIVPATSGELDDLIAAGRAVPATISGPIPMPTHKARPGADAGELLTQLRDEERR